MASPADVAIPRSSGALPRRPPQRRCSPESAEQKLRARLSGRGAPGGARVLEREGRRSRSAGCTVTQTTGGWIADGAARSSPQTARGGRRAGGRRSRRMADRAGPVSRRGSACRARMSRRADAPGSRSSSHPGLSNPEIAQLLRCYSQPPGSVCTARERDFAKRSTHPAASRPKRAACSFATRDRKLLNRLRLASQRRGTGGLSSARVFRVSVGTCPRCPFCRVLVS